MSGVSVVGASTLYRLAQILRTRGARLVALPDRTVTAGRGPQPPEPVDHGEDDTEARLMIALIWATFI